MPLLLVVLALPFVVAGSSSPTSDVAETQGARDVSVSLFFGAELDPKAAVNAT
jgi:hypothetical protein